jgi:hypothetical protein
VNMCAVRVWMVVDGCKRCIRYAGGPTKREMAGNKSDITVGLTDPELCIIKKYAHRI